MIVKPKMPDNAVILRKSDLSQTIEIKCVYGREINVRTEIFNLTGKMWY